jgi:hypothetical protein
MSKKIRIEKTEQCTIYSVGISDKFRVLQNSDEEFIIQKLFKETETKRDFLWWKKTSSWDEWKRVDENGQKYYYIGYYIPISNYCQFKTYKNLDKAIKWIYDYNKYPIYY